MTTRLIPNLFIVGAAKSGTTSLYKYLSQHPEVYMSPVKEPHYFSQMQAEQPYFLKERTITDESSYFKLFEKANGYKVIGEASPSYLWDSTAPYRIYQINPNSKIIILLREPIDRAFSHYLMDCRGGLQQKGFYEAIMEDYNREKKGWWVSHLYVEIGLYYQQVTRYIDVFGSSQVLVILFDDFKDNTNAVLEEVLNFLNVSIKGIKKIDYNTKHNAFSMPNGKLSRAVLNNRTLTLLGGQILPETIKDYLKKRLFFKKTEKPDLEDRARQFLYQIYAENVACLKKLLNKQNLWSAIYN